MDEIPPVSPHHPFPFKIVLISIFLLLTLSATLFLGQKKHDVRSRASGTVALRLSPDTISKQIGDSFLISILIDTKEDTVSAIDLSLHFDTSKIRLLTINKSDYLPIELHEASTQNGIFHVTLGSAPTKPQKGTGIITTLQFEGIAAGNTTLEITTETEVAAVGKNENVLSQTYSSQVTITSANRGGAASPTSQPEPQPSQASSPTETPIPQHFGNITNPLNQIEKLNNSSEAPALPPNQEQPASQIQTNGDTNTVPVDTLPSARNTEDTVPWNYVEPKKLSFFEYIILAIKGFVCRIFPCNR